MARLFVLAVEGYQAVGELGLVRFIAQDLSSMGSVATIRRASAEDVESLPHLGGVAGSVKPAAWVGFEPTDNPSEALVKLSCDSDGQMWGRARKSVFGAWEAMSWREGPAGSVVPLPLDYERLDPTLRVALEPGESRFFTQA